MSLGNQTRMLRRFACAVGLSAMLAATSGCLPFIGYDDYPPDAYIATTAPVYFEGRPMYWYGNRWSYREGGRWNHYDREPAGLYQRRMQGPPFDTLTSRPAGVPLLGRWQTGRSTLNMTASTSCTIISATAFMSGARTAVLTVQAWVGFRLDSVRGRIAVQESGCAQAASWLDKRSR
jgi:hypothetical protein